MKKLSMALAALLLAGAAGVALSQSAGDPSAELGGAERYLTHLSTDKPVYRAGETVYVRAVVLGAHDHKPVSQPAPPWAWFEVQGPKGDVIASGTGQTQDSIATFQWVVPAGQAGGEHTLVIKWQQSGWAPAERTFDVRAYRAPRLKTQIVFVKDGYGPGETVKATLHVERPEGGAPAGAPVQVVARVDGAEVYRGSAKVDASGNVDASFALPKSIDRGEGTLAMTVTDGGVVETATKTLPILVQTVDLQLFPEGGDLVGGLPCRVYFEGRQPNGKPADMDGIVVDAAGREVARFQSGHDGRGVFGMVPAPGEGYEVQVVRPAGIKKTWALPDVKAAGAVLRAVRQVTAPGAKVELEVGATAKGAVLVTLSQKERELSRQTVTLGAGQVVPVALEAGAASGVLVATAWDANGRPLAERLVFRKPATPLAIAVKTDKERYVPGDEVELTVTATAGGKPVEALVGLTVTDDTVLELIDKRDQAPRLPAMVFLETEVRELTDAHVYLDPANPEADEAVDLLLGTQGWRRFAFVTPKAFVEANGDPARRVLALVEPVTLDFEGTGRGGGGIGLGAVRGLGAVPMAPPAGAAPPPDEAPVAVAPQPMPEPVVLANADPPRPAEPEVVEEPMAEAAEKQVMGPRQRAAGKGIAAVMKAEARDEAWGWGGQAWAREYAHQVRPGRQAGQRADFTETLYWAAGVRTDPKTGAATVRFGLSDSVTGFRVLADGFTGEGAVGQGTGLVESVEPFHVEPKLPLHVTQGDTVRLPVAVTNGTDAPLEGSLALTLGGKAGPTAAFVADARAGVRRVLDLEIDHPIGELSVALAATAGSYGDSQTRTLSVEANGFPQEVGFGGLLEPGRPVAREVAISAGLVKGSLTARLEVHPTPLASLTSAFERLIQEPYGCFEQTSSTTYPLVMAQQYFTSHAGVDPKLIARSSDLLAKGYERLRGFECKKKGYEWFGEDPAHEALTAYGLLEFTDMATVRDVDRDMLARTRSWLLGQRDGKGGFKRERRALHTWIEDRDASNAYIVYALVATGGKEGLENELLSLEDAALGSKDAYVWGLTANALQLGGRAAGAKELLGRLVKAQRTDGAIGGAIHSIVGSSGDALDIEATALATMAWLRSPDHQDNVEKAVRWLADACKGGRYGSTQSTVLALQAIVEYDKARARPKAPGTIRLLVDGALVGAVPFDGDTKGAIALPDLAPLMTPGKHSVTIEMEGGGAMPVTGAVTWTDTSPASSKDCPVGLETQVVDTTLTEGDVTELVAVITNRTEEAVPTPVAILGLPGGLEPRHDQLKELVKAGSIAAYEIRGRDVVLYWRDLGPKRLVRVPVSLLAAVPGTYTGPASRAYLYYGDEHKVWTPGAQVTIAPKS
ncbi:MAG: hypothetical protein AMXMBFR64_30850 [Myxococcales bacterium]